MKDNDVLTTPDVPMIHVTRDIAKRTRRLGHDFWNYYGSDWSYRLLALADELDLRANEWERERGSENENN
jgi:hypothetical protein